MNIDAKPWYPGATPVLDTEYFCEPQQSGDFDFTSGCYPSASAAAAAAACGDVCSTRRHDPYRTSSFSSTVPSSERVSPIHTGGHHDYSEAMYKFMKDQNLIDGPPSYQEFVSQPQQSGIGSSGSASPQPYRSAVFRYHPANVPVPCDMVSDMEHHGASASGSHSGGSDHSATPRQSAAAKAPVNIPLPRSRRSEGNLVTSPTASGSAALQDPSSAPLSSQSSPVCQQSPNFPLPAPRSKGANQASSAGYANGGSAEDVDSYLKSVTNAMREPQRPTPVTVDSASVETLHAAMTTRVQQHNPYARLASTDGEHFAQRLSSEGNDGVDDVEQNMIDKLVAMLQGRHNNKAKSGAAEEQQQQQQRSDESPIADPVDSANSTGMLSTAPKPQIGGCKREQSAPKKAPQQAPAASLEPAASSSSSTSKKKTSAAAKKKDEWKTVESSSSANHTTHKTAVASLPQKQVVVAPINKFELVGKRSKPSKPLVESDSDSGSAIMIASAATASDANTKKKKHSSSKHRSTTVDDDKWLEEAAKAGAAAQEHHTELMCVTHKEPLQFMGFLRLDSLPTLAAILPPKPSSSLVSVADALQRAIKEAATESCESRHYAVRRLLAKVMQPSIAAQCPALVVCALVEACDASLELDLGFTHARQAMQIARTHQSLPLELLATFAFCRHCQKLIDGTDCREEVKRALELAVELNETRAMGWIAQIFAVYLEVGGAFHESLCWHYFSNRIAKENGDARLECEALTHIAIATAAVGDMEEATALLTETDKKRHLLSRSAAHRVAQNMAQVCVQCGDLERALQYHIEERDIAKAQGDLSTAATLTNNIASVRRSMDQVEQSLADHQEEMQLIDQCPHARETECLMGLAVTLKSLGQYTKAREHMLRVLRACREGGDHSMTAKCLAEIAECDAADGNFEDAVGRLAEGLRIVDQTSPADMKQYYIKVNMCEAEWKIIDALERLHRDRMHYLEAVRYGDAMRLPNTADVMGILQRKQRRAQPGWAAGHTFTFSKEKTGVTGRAAAAHQAAESFLNNRFFDTSALEALLHNPKVSGVDGMIVYSLRWDDELDFSAYVLTPAADGKIHAAGRRMHLTAPVIQVLAGHRSALFSLFHTRSTDMNGNEIYSDTPLFPQRFSYMQNKLDAAVAERIATDELYCLELLYDCFVRSIDDMVSSISPSNTEACIPPRVVFVGDGVMSMIPFPALYDAQTKTHLLDRWLCTKLPSIQHALTIFAKRVTAAAKSSSCPPVAEGVSMITGSMEHDASQESITSILNVTTVVRLVSEDEVPVDGTPTRDAIMNKDTATASLAKQLVVSTMTPRQRHVRLSNELVRALLLDLPRSQPLVFDLPVVPDVKEDYSGIVCTPRGTLLATSADIAVTWDLSALPLVMLTKFGAYGSRAVHETGVPVYRALLLAGAQRLLLPTGSSLQNVDAHSMEVLRAASSGSDNSSGASCISMQVHNAMKELRAKGHPIKTWSAFTQFGLP